jgi:hypothetical protein
MSRAPGLGPLPGASWSGTKQLNHAMPGAWESWSGTKHLKSLDMSRAPGLDPGYPCLGHWVLGLGPRD